MYIGEEIGSKMRSAIKAKLMELGCYLDDELPDYIMVMVANKRTREQMNKDLLLFLRSNTKVFVEWLQQVLQRLEEVVINKPAVKAEDVRCAKRKILVSSEESDSTVGKMSKYQRDLTDEIPVKANDLVEKRNEIYHNTNAYLIQETKSVKNTINNPGNEFDIKPATRAEHRTARTVLINPERLTENMKLNNKNMVAKVAPKGADFEDEGFMHITAETEEIMEGEVMEKVARNTSSASASLEIVPQFSQKINLSETLREEEEMYRKSLKSRSEIFEPMTPPLPPPPPSPPAETIVLKSRISAHKRLGAVQPEIKSNLKNHLASIVKVKPRKMESVKCGGTKLLLLKAMADAQKSIALTQPKSAKAEEKLTCIDKVNEKLRNRKLQQESTKKVKAYENIVIKVPAFKETEKEEIIDEMETNSVPEAEIEQNANDANGTAIEPQFIITLGKLNYKQEASSEPPPAPRRLVPSPIIFEGPSKVETLPQAALRAEALPQKAFKAKEYRVVRPHSLQYNMKFKERCKYWPSCLLGNACEFAHPQVQCNNFPNCKFGNRCLYLHPKCKFGNSCTKRNCQFSHSGWKRPANG